jgi:hypothetical protein
MRTSKYDGAAGARMGQICGNGQRQQGARCSCPRRRTRTPPGAGPGQVGALGRRRCWHPGAGLLARRGGPGVFWRGDADRESCGARMQTCSLLAWRGGPGGPVGCAPRGIPRSWRPRLPDWLPQDEARRSRRQLEMPAARQCWLDAAECGEARRRQVGPFLTRRGGVARRGGVRRLPSRGSWPCRRGSGCRRGCAASARRARQSA